MAQHEMNNTITSRRIDPSNNYKEKSSLKEIANRLQKLSYTDMLTFSRMLSNDLVDSDHVDVANALLKVAASLENKVD